MADFNPTAFLNVPSGIGQQAALSGLQAASMGQQAGMTQRSWEQGQQKKHMTDSLIQQGLASWKAGDRAGYAESLRNLTGVDPKAAQEFQATFGAQKWQNVVEAGYNVYAAMASSDEAAQNKLLDNAVDTLSASDPNNWMVQGLKSIRNMPFDSQERNAELIGSVEMLKNLGVYPKGTKAGGGADSKSQKTGAFWIQNDKTGEMQLVTGVFNPTTEEFKLAGAKTPEGWSLADRTGLTPEQKRQEKIETKRGEARVGAQEKRTQEVIQDGLDAAESVAGLKRGIDLLDTIKTGGVNAAALRAKQLFGIETADEGELSNQLSKAVLSQLRSTFGAAFTEREGARLERIEAGFSKSSEANKRLLNQALMLAENKAKQARKRALEIGDQGTVDQIDELLSFTYSMGEKTPETTESGQGLRQIKQSSAQNVMQFQSTEEGEASNNKYYRVGNTIYENERLKGQ